MLEHAYLVYFRSINLVSGTISLFLFSEGGASSFEVGLKMLMSMPSTKEIKNAVSKKIGGKKKGKTGH